MQYVIFNSYYVILDVYFVCMSVHVHVHMLGGQWVPINAGHRLEYLQKKNLQAVKNLLIMVTLIKLAARPAMLHYVIMTEEPR